MSNVIYTSMNWITIGDGLAQIRIQAITWNNDDLLIAPLWIKFSQIKIKLHQFLFKKMLL